MAAAPPLEVMTTAKEVEFIVITLCTNIDNTNARSSVGNQTTQESKQNIDLTSSMLSYDKPVGETPVMLTKYPFFSRNVLYDPSIFINLPYHSIVEIFFNENNFRRLLLNRLPLDNNPKNMASNGDKNIMTMLLALFPTAYPIKSAVSESISIFFSKFSARKITQMLNDVFRGEQYCYMKINSKVYTVKQAIWLNDLLNHPKYRLLIEEFQLFRNQVLKLISKKDTQLNKMSSTETARREPLQKEIKQLADLVNGTDVSNLNAYFKNFANILSKFKSTQPPREIVSSNEDLQEMIDSPDVSSLFGLLVKIYGRFFLQTARDSFKEEELSTSVGLLPQKTSNDPKYRIYVLMDFIEGKLTYDIVNSVDCKFQDVDLARTFRHLTADAKNTYEWDVDRARYMYKLKYKTDKKTEIKEYSVEIVPLTVMKPRLTYDSTQFDAQQFIDWVFYNTKFSDSAKVKALLDQLKKERPDTSEFTILDTIKTRHTQLYDFITRWNMSSDRYDDKFIENMRFYRRKLQRELDERGDDEFARKVIQLLTLIVDVMIQIEKAKNVQSKYGGSRKKNRRGTRKLSKKRW
jgi:hypothetical protein